MNFIDSHKKTNRNLPEGARAYSETKLFTAKTVPAALLRDHRTKKGAWGVIEVMVGEIKYFLAGQDSPEAIVKAGDHFVILPQELHFVKLSDDAVFKVVFHKML